MQPLESPRLRAGTRDLRVRVIDDLASRHFVADSLAQAHIVHANFFTSGIAALRLKRDLQRPFVIRSMPCVTYESNARYPEQRCSSQRFVND
jgi:hypothetical protein